VTKRVRRLLHSCSLMRESFVMTKLFQQTNFFNENAKCQEIVFVFCILIYIYIYSVCVCVSMCVCFNLLSRLHRSYSSSSFNSVLFRSDRLFIYYLVHESRVVHVHGVVLECGIDRSRVDWFQDH
jgi:hypothetical protein